VGLKQYYRALLEAGDDEERVALGIASLEGVLLQDQNTSEQARRTLSQRSAALLRAAGLNPVTVAERVQEAYKCRSRYFHGRAPEKSIEKEKAYRYKVTALRVPVLNYARLVLLKYLESDPAKWEKEILPGLDRGLLDSKTGDLLTATLAGGLWEVAMGFSETHTDATGAEAGSA
jgi:hypothetical protein